jgi:hypothetical protein
MKWKSKSFRKRKLKSMSENEESGEKGSSR